MFVYNTTVNESLKTSPVKSVDYWVTMILLAVFCKKCTYLTLSVMLIAFSLTRPLPSFKNIAHIDRNTRTQAIIRYFCCFVSEWAEPRYAVRPVCGALHLLWAGIRLCLLPNLTDSTLFLCSFFPGDLCTGCTGSPDLVRPAEEQPGTGRYTSTWLLCRFCVGRKKGCQVHSHSPDPAFTWPFPEIKRAETTDDCVETTLLISLKKESLSS